MLLTLCFHCYASDDLLREAVALGDVMRSEELLKEGEVSEEFIDQLFYEVFFIRSEWESEIPLDCRKAIGKLLIQHGAPRDLAALGSWAFDSRMFPIYDGEVWKMLSSLIPDFDTYQKCAFINALIRRQCYETYGDYPKFLEELSHEFGIDESEDHFSSFLPKKEDLQAYIEYSEAHGLSFSSKEEIAEFIERICLSPPEEWNRGFNWIFSGFLGLLDNELGLTIDPSIRSHLIMNFFQQLSMESAYLSDRSLIYFTDQFFEKIPSGIDPEAIVFRILEGVDFEELEILSELQNSAEIRSIYAWYHLLNTDVVKEYVQSLPSEDQRKIELLLQFALQEGSDKGSLLSIFKKLGSEFFTQNLQQLQENLSLFTDLIIEQRGDHLILNLYIDEDVNCVLHFLDVESLDKEIDDDVMKISYLHLEGAGNMTIGYFKEEDPHLYVMEIRAKKMLVYSE